MKKIKVSVVVPAYNVQDYIGECIESIINQSLKDIEIIIIDDGSDDKTLSIIKEYEKKHPKLKVIHTENRGVSAARNLAIENSIGEYISFVDGDDYINQDMLKLLYNKCVSLNAEVSVCKLIRDTNGICKLSSEDFPDESKKYSVKDNLDLFLAAKSYPCNKLFKRELFTKNKLFFPLNQRFEDSYLIYEVMLKAQSIVFVDEGLYYYRKNVSTAVTNNFSEKFYDVFKSCDHIREVFNKCDFMNAQFVKDSLCILHINARISSINSINSETKKFIKECLKYLEEKIEFWKNNQFLLNMAYLINKYEYKLLLKGYRSIILEKSLKKFKYKVKMLINKSASEKTSYDITTIKDKYNETLKFNKDIQQKLVKILDDFDAFCREHNLIYFLAEGTLLGAVRHKGFIPWDDDIDVSMPREDYEKFKHIVSNSKQFQKKYVIQCSDTMKNYWTPSLKIRLKKDRNYCQQNIAKLTKYNGLFIDVFPLDYLPAKSNIRQIIISKQIRFLKKMLWYKNVGHFPKKFIRIPLYVISKIYSNKFMHYRLNKMMQRYNNVSRKFVVNYGSYYNVFKQIVPFNVYLKQTFLEFENKKYPVPVEYEFLLTSLYNDYKKYPEISKRIGKHSLSKKQKRKR